MFLVHFFVFLEAALLMFSCVNCFGGGSFDREKWRRDRCEWIGTIHLEIYLVLDTKYVAIHQENISQCRPYLETLVNNVEAYFWPFNCPDLIITLVGVKVLTSEEEKQFKKYKIFKNDTTPKLDPAFTLSMFNRWVNNDTTFQDADVVYLLTSEEIRDYMVAYKLEMKAASYSSGPCHNRRTALSKDDGKTFSGVPAMVQQIGRLLGIKWDDSRSTEKPCRVTDGYIMSKNGEPTELANFSSCSYDTWDFNYFLPFNNKNYFNRTTEAMDTENDELPANFFNGSDYCQVLSERKNTTTCESPTGPENGAVDTPCHMRCCFENTNVTVNSPDGTRCDNETVCLQGMCVEERKRNITISE
uniref:Putative secreted metalloprotease n=1 Tax=Ixodes ricinus TaxID=34613 RepID=A0A147BI16_IXORI